MELIGFQNCFLNHPSYTHVGESFNPSISMQGKLSQKSSPQKEFIKSGEDGENQSIGFYFSATHNFE